jgi:hypothetical protein
MRRHTWSGAAVAAALSLVIVGCSSDSSAPVEVQHGPTPTGSTQIALTRKADTLTVDQALQLRAILPPAPGTIAPAITWASSDTSVAFVTQSGVLFGLKTGKTTVTVSSRGFSDAAVIDVRAGIRDVVFEADSIAISLTQSVKIPFRVRDTDGNVVDLAKHRVEWVSTAPDIAPLTGDATVTGRSIGKADLLLRVDNKVGSTRVRVLSKPVASVFVQPSSLVLAAGISAQLTATTYDVNGNPVTGRNVSWSTSNAEVARVSAEGVVTTVAAGTAEINVNAEGRKAVVPVTVTTGSSSSTSVPVASVSVTLNAPSLLAGQSTQANATLKDANGGVLTGRSVVWTSSDPTVASVDGSGAVATIKAGNVTITASSEGKSGSASLSVGAPTVGVEPVATVAITLPSSLDVGQSAQASVTLKDQSGNTLGNRAIAFVSSDANIASVTTNGVVTALKGGAVTITASSEGKSASAVVTAVAPKPAVHMITLAAGSTNLKIGEITQVTAVPKDINGVPISGLTITWWSSPTTVATVSSSGVAAARSAGTAQVYAKADTVTRSIALTVAEEAVPDPETTPSTGGSGTLQAVAAMAELPRASVNTAYPAPARQVRVAAGANLQSAIDAAQPGDELLLAPGATYIGNFYLRNKGSSTAWITIRTDVSDAAIGAQGTRMTPSRAASANLAKILTPNNASALATELSAHHWRLTGIEVSGTPAAAEINGIIRLGDGSGAQNSMSLVAHTLVIDRVYVHGLPSQAVRRCISLQSATSAVVDSWISECHSNNGDSQGIIGWNGPGPYLIKNNRIEGGHQGVFFGGADPAIANLSPSDISVIGNHITRPNTWIGVWQTKTIIETKNARRMLLEGNVIENVWESAQAGYAVLLKSENQNGGAPWSQSTDITVRYNLIRNMGNGFNLAANPGSFASVPAARITIVDNVLENLGRSPYIGQGIPLQILGATSDVLVAHNSWSNAGNQAVSFDGAPTVRTVIHSNVLPHGFYGVKGSNTGIGTGTLNYYAPGGVFAYDVLVGGDCTYYPSTTSCPGSIPSSLSPGYDARTIGADRTKVNAATSGVIVNP